ncbi:MAG: ATP-binding protein [Myxococcota bacterium]|nr:ATP-binding protein [Myxococcota bacterium]
MPCPEPARSLLLRYLLAARPWRLLGPPSGSPHHAGLPQAWIRSRLADPAGLGLWEELADALPPLPDVAAVDHAGLLPAGLVPELPPLARLLLGTLLQLTVDVELAGWLARLGCLRQRPPDAPGVAWSFVKGALAPSGEGMAALQEAAATLLERGLVTTADVDRELSGLAVAPELSGLLALRQLPAPPVPLALGPQLWLWPPLAEPAFAELATAAWPILGAADPGAPLVLAGGGVPEALLFARLRASRVGAAATGAGGVGRGPGLAGALLQLELPDGAPDRRRLRLAEELRRLAPLSLLVTGSLQGPWLPALTAGVMLHDPRLVLASRLARGEHAVQHVSLRPTAAAQRRVAERVAAQEAAAGGKPREALLLGAGLELRQLRAVARRLAHPEREAQVEELAGQRLGQRLGLQPVVEPELPLVLHPQTAQELQGLLDQISGRERALRLEGFRRLAGERSLVLLFEGESSVMQLKALCQVARRLGRQLLEVDVAAVLSKYLGETEAQLRELFVEAEASGFGLFLDNAENLLGRRTEQRSSADRYVALQVGFLLQQIETFRGLLVLRTTRPRELDAATLRRLSHRLRFRPLPPAEQARLWQSLIPAGAPVQPGIDWLELATEHPLDINGIQKALFLAAMRAATGRGPLTVELLREAATEERRQSA